MSRRQASGAPGRDRYYARNVGHEVAEFEANPVYYRENYANKPWLGIQGWETRVALQKAQPKVNRKSIIFADRMTALNEEAA